MSIYFQRLDPISWLGLNGLTRFGLGLGDEFETEFYSALARVESNPLLFAADATWYRPCRLKRFTAVLYYRASDELIVLTGLFVNGRDERRLNERG